MRLTTLIAILVTTYSLQADVMSWRNAGNGEYPESSIPVEWNDHVLWQRPLDDFSNACPILVGDKLFFNQEPSTLICADRSNGEILWRRENSRIDLLGFNEAEKAEAREMLDKDFGLQREVNRLRNDLRRLNRRLENDQENAVLKENVEKKRSEINALREQRQAIANDPKFGAVALAPTHRVNGYTSFTPVSDGRQVYVAFGQGILAAYDLEGNRVWSKLMEPPSDANTHRQWGGSTSPILVAGKLIVRFQDIAALDPETGKEIWRIPSKTAYGTPAVFEVEGQPFLITGRGEVIRAADGATIQSGLIELTPDFVALNSPVINKDTIYIARRALERGQKGKCFALRIPPNLDMLHNEGLTEIWRSDVHEHDYLASPIAHKGLVYILDAHAVLTVLRAQDGERVLEKKIDGLSGRPYSSICLVGDKLVLGSDEGTIISLQPGREYKELGRSRFDTFRSTPIFSENVAYLRTYESLFAVGER